MSSRGLHRGRAGHARADLRCLARTRPADCGCSTSTTRMTRRSSPAAVRGAPNGCRAPRRHLRRARAGRSTPSTIPPTNPDVVAPEGERPPYVVLRARRPDRARRRRGIRPRSPTSPAAASACSTSTTAARAATAARTASACAGSGGSSTSRMSRPPRAGSRDRGRADPARLAIAGGSAGGWTVLCALVRTDAFAAGITRYGVADARALAADTHDFEARYLDGLIGPLPDAEQLYIERSPLSHLERFRVPLLLLQGADDLVVPPSQSEAIRDALAAHGVPHAYVAYAGEGHGFRRAENDRRTRWRRSSRSSARCSASRRRACRRSNSTESSTDSANGASSAARRSRDVRVQRPCRPPRGPARRCARARARPRRGRRGRTAPARALRRPAAAAPPRSPRAARRCPRRCATTRRAPSARGRAAPAACRRRRGRPC